MRSSTAPALLAIAALALACSPANLHPDAAPDAGAEDIIPVDAGPDCEALCATFAARCGARIDQAACTTACMSASPANDAGTMDAAAPSPGVRTCLQTAGEACSAASRCLRPPPSLPFAEGTYGTTPRSLAGPFILPTTEGDWSLRDEWTGEDHYVFLVYAPGVIRFPNGTDLFVDLFAGSVADLVHASPPNVHYFFLWYRDEPAFDQFRANALAELDALPAAERAHWRPRVHFVTTRADLIDGPPGDLVRTRLRSTLMVKRYEPFQWAIDRTQHIREVGQLGTLTNGGLAADLTFLAHEPTYYNFEWEREQRLRAQPATVVPILEDARVVETAYAEVTLPNAATMASFDTLEVDLAMNCENHRDGDCGAWDYLSDLRLCEAPAPSGVSDGGAADGTDANADAGPPPRCDTEIARWITSYWREGRWVTDISQMLPLLRAGGRQRFRWYASRQWDPRPANYVVSLSLRFSNRGRGMRPVEVRPLWNGGPLDAEYNGSHSIVRFTVPAGVRRVELYALITGHGSETNQCAEFCNHTHHFFVNGAEHTLAFPEARSNFGCAERVNAGVVPNQHGTWYFGRGGWCPGADVRPFIADLTANLRAETENELSYQALIGTTAPIAGRSYGNIAMSSYLVFWQ